MKRRSKGGRLSGAAEAIRAARRASGLSQESFSLVSSRTYVSSLERGLKSPTLAKLNELASLMNVHPGSIAAAAFLLEEDRPLNSDLLRRRNREIRSLVRRAMDARDA